MAIKGIKSGKAAGEDEFRSETLKALVGEGIPWFTRVCQVMWKYSKTPREWQTGVIISIYEKGDCKQCTNYKEISLLSFARESSYMQNASQENAKKIMELKLESMRVLDSGNGAFCKLSFSLFT